MSAGPPIDNDVCDITRTPEANSNSKNSTNGNVHLTGQDNLKFHFHNVTYAVKHDKSKAEILHDTCGSFKTGRLTAILGPSGAGKTSMLNVLSGFKARGVSGHFRLNGEERNLLDFRKMSSYIPQDFSILHLLTIEETLKISTDLKLPWNTTSTKKQKIIDEILKILNMEKCRNTLVCKISGGERKRISIGSELVTNPPIMFFDEPTSGLDSVASYQVLKYLQRLAHDGRIIVCVVHQPSSRLLELFDDVLVLSTGQVLYSGPQVEMVQFFEQAGYSCPNYYNPADYVLEVASEEMNDKLKILIQRNKNLHCKEDYANNSSGHAHEKTKMLCNSSSNTETVIELGVLDSGADVIDYCGTVIRPKSQINLWRQFSVLTRRSFKTIVRNMIAVQLRFYMHILVGVLLGTVYWNIGNDAAKVLTNSSCLFFVVMFVFFGNAMPSILLCSQDISVFIREYLNGWYSIIAYYAAKIVSDLPVQIACPTIFVAIVYFMTGQPLEIERFAMTWGICLVTAFIGHFLGLTVGSAFDIQMAVFLVPSISIPFMVFSGYFIRLHEVASFLRIICDISFFRYALEGFTRAIYGFDRKELVCKEDFCYFKSPQKFLKELDMLDARYQYDIAALLIWIVLLKILFFLVLVMRIRRAQ